MAISIGKKSDEVTTALEGLVEIAKEAVAAPAKKTVSKSELATIMMAIRKEKGEHILVAGSSIPVVERMPTGVFEFDLATGGGFPKGRYSLLYGPEGSGKTNHTYCAIANAQRLPPPCNNAVFVDLEGTFDPVWAAMFGVDVDNLIVVKPSYGEEAMDMIDALVRAEDVAILVVDSLAMVLSTKEIQQSAEKFDVGTTAILIKRMCNKLTLALAEERKRGHNPCVILLNQIRNKVGVMFGNPETMPGGFTMKFLSSLTIRITGKNVANKEVHPELAAYKHTEIVIQKAKVPITRLSIEYDMCVYPSDDLSVGESKSWNKVSADLKDLGFLVKTNKGWKLSYDQEGKPKVLEAPTLVLYQDSYESDPEFALACQALIINSSKGQMFLVAGKDGAK